MRSTCLFGFIQLGIYSVAVSLSGRYLYLKKPSIVIGRGFLGTFCPALKLHSRCLVVRSSSVCIALSVFLSSAPPHSLPVGSLHDHMHGGLGTHRGVALPRVLCCVWRAATDILSHSRPGESL
jgi:hypothetical protein